MEQEVIRVIQEAVNAANAPDSVNWSEQFMLFLGWLGLYCPMILGAIGSILGCGIAGSAAFGAMLEAEEGHARFITLAILPSSQVFYGFLVMLLFNGSAAEVGITVGNSIGLFTVGMLCGLTLLLSAVRQGQCCAAAMNTIKTKPEVFGLSFVSPAAIEGMALFAFVFSILLQGTIFMVK